MATKRKKWTNEEDEALRNIMISINEEEPNWESVSKLMEGIKYLKTPKQCRERWMH